METIDVIRTIASSLDQRAKGNSVEKNGSFSLFSGQLSRSSRIPLSLWVSMYTSNLFSELPAGWKSFCCFCKRIYTSMVAVATRKCLWNTLSMTLLRSLQNSNRLLNGQQMRIVFLVTIGSFHLPRDFANAVVDWRLKRPSDNTGTCWVSTFVPMPFKKMKAFFLWCDF